MQNTKRMERQADAVNSDGARLLQKRLPSTMKLGAFTTTQDSTDMKTIERWHGGKARDYESWIIPSALLMTAAFSLVMALPTADAAPPPDALLNWLTDGGYAGSTTEKYLRDGVSHLYLFLMVTSGMAALRCVNDFTAALLLNANTPPDQYVKMHAVRTDDAWRKDMPPGLCPHLAAKSVLACSVGKPGQISSQLSGLLFGGANDNAYFSAVYRLGFGIALGVFHRYGSSHALAVVLPYVLCSASRSASASASAFASSSASLPPVLHPSFTSSPSSSPPSAAIHAPIAQPAITKNMVRP